MQRIIVAALAPIVVCSLVCLSGCGGDGDGTAVAPSVAAKKADTGAQNGMMEYMQSKGASKAKAKP